MYVTGLTLMSKGFWGKLKKPIMALAPMANVTDTAFRRIIIKYSRYGGTNIFDAKGKFTPLSAKRAGGPDVMWTEFVSCEGLLSKGKKKLLDDLIFDESERPIVAQIFGSKPEQFCECAELIKKLGFDGIDINMGCPDKSVIKQGAGAALIKNPKLAQEIIRQAQKGAESAGWRMPVSVKTRTGDSKNELKKWLPYLLEMEPAAIIVHARTRKEMSLVPARWKTINEAVEIRDKYDLSLDKTLILGNGDVSSLEEAQKRAEETGADGIMVGRGIFGNPWFFNSDVCESPQMKIKVLLEHAFLFEKIFRERKKFEMMKKHFKAYINGFKGAKELRIKVMEAQNARELKEIVGSFSFI